MQTRQIVAQTCVFAFDSTNHVGLADNLVAVGNEAWIDWVAITEEEITLPN